MKSVVLYLDKLNEQMEKLLLDLCPPDIDIRFLQPNVGRKGEFADAAIFFVTTYPVTKDVIDSAPNLKLIQRTGVGLDMVDVRYAKSKGIEVSVSAGCNATSVAELAIGLMLSLYRHIPKLDTLTKNGKWCTWTYRHISFEIVGKTVGVLGVGAIGREVIKRLNAFGATIIYYDVSRLSAKQEEELNATYVDFDTLVRTADIVSLHLPLLPNTVGLIGEKQFREMKKSAILINTARGRIVDQKALVDALKNGEIAGAASDVFFDMPADPNDPLFKLDDANFIATPHIGAATYDNYYRVFNLCLNNVRRVMNNEKVEFTV